MVELLVELLAGESWEGVASARDVGSERGVGERR